MKKLEVFGRRRFVEFSSDLLRHDRRQNTSIKCLNQLRRRRRVIRLHSVNVTGRRGHRYTGSGSSGDRAQNCRNRCLNQNLYVVLPVL